MMATAVAVAGSLGSLDAQNGDHPFSTTWCSSPVVVPLVDASALTTTPSEGVVTARGAKAVLSSRGPVIRMTEQGSRVQVTLGQTLFHTQWLLGAVDEGDRVRVDAFLGQARQEIDASSARGALVVSDEQSTLGLTTESRAKPRSTGEIDVFVGATELLFTNEGTTPVDIIAAIGCPALEVSTDVISAPTWDAELQRFVAEHEVSFRNRLANPRTSALRSQNPLAANTAIDDLSVDLAVAAAGFRSAEITSMALSRELDLRQNLDFNGFSDTGVLETPLRLTNSGQHRIRFTVSYEPNFDDTTWSEGVSVPAPTVSLRGRVDDVQVGVSAVLRPDGAEVDLSTSPSRLVTPAPDLTVEHEYLQEPSSRPDGNVVLSERIVVKNIGDTRVDELVVRYPLVDMYGPGSVLPEFAGLASHGCRGTFSKSFDGSRNSVAVYDPTGLDVGESCTIDIRGTVRPGTVPTVSGEQYEAPVTATARSGAREVRDTIAARTTLAQNPQISFELSDVEATNLEDGRYRFDGSLTLRNLGDQNLTSAAGRIDVVTTTNGETSPAEVSVANITGDETCGGLGVPRRATTGAALTAGNTLTPGQECTVNFELISRPGRVLDGWAITTTGEAFSARGLPVSVVPKTSEIDISEAPAIESETTLGEIVNNGDGTYTTTVITEITNTGDKPLIEVITTDTGDDVFGSTIIAAERIGDSCSAIAPGSPLRAASQAENGPTTCSVTEQYVVAPAAKLTDWMIESSSNAVSTSGVTVDSTAELESAINFTESPKVETSIDITSIEKVDDTSVRLVLRSVLENTGDIEVRNVQAQLDLDEALDGADYTIEAIGADGVIASTNFNGRSQTQLLSGTDEIARGAQAEIRVVVLAETKNDSGPFAFELETAATAPSRADLDVPEVSVERTIPLIGIIDRALVATNNNDGTYDIEHTVIARNVGNGDVPRIDITTNFAGVFGEFVLGEVTLESNCNSAVLAGDSCTSVRKATLRPGSAVGPYTVAASIASADDGQLDALVVPEPRNIQFEARANTPLRFEERPSISIETDVSEPTNNGDATHSLDYSTTVTNTGDVPLYRVGVSDFATQFADAALTNELTTDTCAAVSFASPLGPQQSCSRAQAIKVWPGQNLGPWVAETRVSADSPSFATVLEEERFEAVTFEETVTIDVTSTLATRTNNGDGTYNVAYELTVTNSGDVPLISVDAADPGDVFGEKRLAQEVVFDSCIGIAPSTPLAPGSECRIELNQRLQPGSELGPFEISNSVTAASYSAATVEAETTSNALTLTEAPKLELKSKVVSVESVDPDTFRVVTNLTIENAGDVRVDDLDVMLDLSEVFPESTFRIDGLISNDFVVDEAFAAGESLDMLAEGQRLGVGAAGTITLILSVEPGDVTGPFVGDLRAEGRSPAGKDVSSVIAAQVDLPSVAIDVVAQSVDNNRDGSYTVTTSYELTNDGSTPLEFVRLIEDIGATFGGTNARTLSVESAELATADLTDRRRGNDVLEWGSTLDTGGSAIVTTTVLVEPGNVLGPFVPSASLSALSPAGTPVSATGFAPDEVEFVERPALRVSQRLLSRPAWNNSGTFDVSFAIEVVNDGDVELRSLQIQQDLLNALGANSQIRVTDIRSETLAVNPDFDGLGQPPRTVDPVDSEEADEPVDTRPSRDIGDTRLLLGWNTLPAGETGVIELDLRLAPEERGVYSTRVVVSALSPAGTGLGSGGDTIEANTLTRLSVQGEIGVAKQTIGEATVRPDGAVGVTYEILVENAGPFPLTNVEVHDQLSQAFGVGSTFVTSRVRIEANSPCEGFASSSYDGGTIDPVLVSGVELNPGERCRIQYDAVVIPSKELPGPFRSSAFAIASDPFSGTVIDDSTDGTNIDPDGNQEPGDNDIATSVRVTVPEPAAELVVEPLDSSALGADSWYEFGYAISLTNTGAIDLDTTRLNAALDDAWTVPYEVVSISSDDLVVNSSFDGESRSNLLQRRNRLRAGDTAVVNLRIRAVKPRSGDLAVPFTFRASSVTGAEVEVDLDEPAAALAPGDAVATAWLDTLSTEEKRLLALGSAVILLFAFIFARQAMIRVRRFRKVRAVRRAEVLAQEELFIDLRDGADSDDDDIVIDLDADEGAAPTRMRAHPPEVDLTDEETLEVEHYSPRRRRGRRPIDSPKS